MCVCVCVFILVEGQTLARGTLSNPYPIANMCVFWGGALYSHAIPFFLSKEVQLYTCIIMFLYTNRGLIPSWNVIAALVANCMTTYYGCYATSVSTRTCPSSRLLYLYTHPPVHTTTSEPSGVEHGRKRHGSHNKSIALELIYKVKGVEVQVTISPAHRTQKKSVEWLRALKKVC